MKIVRIDLLKRVIESARSPTEWPHYAIFLYLEAYDAVIIAPRSWMHGDLFTVVKDDRMSSEGDPVEVDDGLVFDGHIEWDDDGSCRIRTQGGKTLPKEIESQLFFFLNSGEL